MDYLIKHTLERLAPLPLPSPSPSEEKKVTIPSKCVYLHKEYIACTMYAENFCAKQFEGYVKCMQDLK
jgi:hypothetical protein